MFKSNTIENKLDGQKNPDVLLLVIDSVASTQIIRGLPRTINFLMHGMKAVEFRKLNKVGSNSRPNAFPTLLARACFDIGDTSSEPGRLLNYVGGMCSQPERALRDVVDTSCESRTPGATSLTRHLDLDRPFATSVTPLLNDVGGMCSQPGRVLRDIGDTSCESGEAFRNIGKTTEAVVRKPMNLPTIEADWSYNNYCKRYLDDEPFIPLEYKKAGYKTYGGEDYEASILNYPNCFGTKQRQFHHTYRPYHVRLRKDAELKHIHLQGSCRLHHSNMLDYLSLFVNAYKGAPKFSLTWLVDLAHDNTKHIYRADYELYNFFLKNRDALNNSFIFFFGDHGPRFGSVSEFCHRRLQNSCDCL
ncbi:unnamed protein product [Heligmosomoides polygyrus]|uniref:Sulfatase domain-containing protein n=1 Tax=Heligmosomoides polygyrus TaxID=6339 RepID=A0A183GRM0_HELPZ|nr:unnamed protein product [Heligmosomoides polygyrus]